MKFANGAHIFLEHFTLVMSLSLLITVPFVSLYVI